MAKGAKISRSSANGQFVTKAIGSSKSAKFSAVEGLSMTKNSKAIAEQAASRGLKGADYRAAITKSFKKS